MVAGDGPSFGPEAGDALNFGPTGRMGVPHLVHEQIFRNGFVKQHEELEGGARRERRGGNEILGKVKILQVSTIVRQNFYQEEHLFDARK